MAERKKQLQAIKTNKERNHKTYYLMMVVTPEGLFLDNSVFCNGKNTVKRWTLDVIDEIPDTRRFESKKYNSAHFVA
eukprot:scaffold95724_cov54-Attheya_sp.AAC.1